MALITAKFRSACGVCGQEITPGAQIHYSKGTPTRHATCQPVVVPTDAVHLSQGSGYARQGFSGWTPGEVIPNPHPKVRRVVSRRFRCPVCGELPGNYCGAGPKAQGHTAELLEELVTETPTSWANEPDFLVVLTAHRRYFREDGLSFGVGEDSGYVYEATCRPATPEEAAPVQAQIAQTAQRQIARKMVRQLERHFIDSGEYVEGSHLLQGERLDIGSGQTITGGGAWFVVEAEHIWHVLNNGGDGDTWASNNVRTGGAGAIGRRLPRTAELERELRTLLTQAWG